MRATYFISHERRQLPNCSERARRPLRPLGESGEERTLNQLEEGLRDARQAPGMLERGPEDRSWHTAEGIVGEF